jgi:hypothetical protein
MLNEEKVEQFWEEHNAKLNTIIGKITVPAMTLGNAMVKEVHTELLDLAHWVDEQMKSITDDKAS